MNSLRAGVVERPADRMGQRAGRSVWFAYFGAVATGSAAALFFALLEDSEMESDSMRLQLENALLYYFVILVVVIAITAVPFALLWKIGYRLRLMSHLLCLSIGILMSELVFQLFRGWGLRYAFSPDPFIEDAREMIISNMYVVMVGLISGYVLSRLYAGKELRLG